MDSNKKLVIAAGGAAIAAIGGFVAYWLAKPATASAAQIEEQQKSCPVSKEKIMLICNELRSQIFSTALQIVEKRASIISQIEQGAQLPEGTQVETYVEEIASAIFQAKQRLVCQKFEIPIADFEAAIAGPYENDANVMAIQKHIDKIFLDACAGIQPDLSLPKEVIEFLTPATVVLLHVKFFKLAAAKYIQAFQEIKAGGDIEMSFENPVFLKKIRDLKIPDAKRQMLFDEGFNKFDLSPREVLDKITQKYKKEDPEFEKGLQLYETSFSGLIDQLAENPFQFDPVTTPETIFPLF